MEQSHIAVLLSHAAHLNPVGSQAVAGLWLQTRRLCLRQLAAAFWLVSGARALSGKLILAQCKVTT